MKDPENTNVFLNNSIYPKPRIELLGTPLYFLGLQFGTVFPIVYVIHRTLPYIRSDI